MTRTPKTPRKQRFRLHEIRAALQAAGGVYAHAAESLTQTTGRSCSRQNIWKWVDTYPSLRRAVEECVEETKDLAESKLLEAIRNNDITAIKFFLETKGRDRGYVRQHSIAGADRKPLMPPPGQVVFYIPDNGRDPEIVKPIKLNECQAKTNGAGIP